MNPAFGILIFIALAIMWIVFTYVVYPFGIEPFMKIFLYKYKNAKNELDDAVNEIFDNKGEE